MRGAGGPSPHSGAMFAAPFESDVVVQESNQETKRPGDVPGRPLLCEQHCNDQGRHVSSLKLWCCSADDGECAKEEVTTSEAGHGPDRMPFLVANKFDVGHAAIGGCEEMDGVETAATGTAPAST